MRIRRKVSEGNQRRPARRLAVKAEKAIDRVLRDRHHLANRDDRASVTVLEHDRRAAVTGENFTRYLSLRRTDAGLRERDS